MKLVKESNHNEVPKGESIENHWRCLRYDFFDKASDNLNVITCHHLDDAVETWLFSSMHGNARLIPERRGKYIRPFLQTRKDAFRKWCKQKDVVFLEDSSNNDVRYMRNLIRHKIIPQALKVNPGIHKTIAKKLRLRAVSSSIDDLLIHSRMK